MPESRTRSGAPPVDGDRERAPRPPAGRLRTSATAPYRNDDAELLRTSAPRARGEHTVREVFIEMQQLSEFAPNQVPHTSIVNAPGDLLNAGAAP